MAPFFPQELIQKKRDGGTLSPAEIAAIVGGIVDGAMGDAQVGAFAMAVFFRGMTAEECADLTRAMARSGYVLGWRSLDLDGPVLDKHSTGGIGDKVSLMLAPIIAACGGFVPMVSGRALGHTGGTVDKLESIPGYLTQPPIEQFRRVVADAGCAIIGQTEELAPADRRLYAIRDVTATVASIPLITASILSKKLAAGLNGLVMDVKFGSGAFMETREQARALAASIVSVAGNAGLTTRALLTDMNQVLGTTAGNALEVTEAVQYLTDGPREARLDRVVRALAAELLVLGRLAGNIAEAEREIERAIQSGAAAERLQRMVQSLGGPGNILRNPEAQLPQAPIRCAAPPLRAGFLRSVDAAAVGRVVLALGGGRRSPQDPIDHAVGLSEVAGIGAAVGPGRPLAVVHARNAAEAEAACAALQAASRVGDAAPASADPVAARL
ncbi:MAG: thymidine phosphorylase [Proteobacteria bacterium]|nr:thymidine phosphorylase [Pseudomonadota bacterium]MBI3497556.1 thymidine phosphorylase [Pseudomonadota bacterium]